MTENPSPTRPSKPAGISSLPLPVWFGLAVVLVVGMGMGIGLTFVGSDDAGLADLRVRLAAVEAVQTSLPAAPAAIETSTIGRRMLDLEQTSQAAFGTLDQQMQALGAQLTVLQAQDAALTKELAATRIALEAELAQWRDRQTPSLVHLAARLAGQAVQFSEGNRFADPTAAEALMRKVVAWLMEAGPDIGLRIIGYADIDGSGEPSNRITSQKRADAVRAAMLQLGVDADRLIAVGRSTEDRLVNDDSAGNANRRVTFAPFYRPVRP